MRKEDALQITGLALTGLCSGIISSVVLFLVHDHINPFIPGIIFSIALGSYFLTLQNQKALLSTSLFVIFSTWSYTVAVLAVLYLPMFVFFPVLLLSAYLGVFVGGIIGTALFLFAFKKFIFPITSNEHTKLYLIGILLSLLCQIAFHIVLDILPYSENFWGSWINIDYGVYIIFPIWQMGMAVSIGWIIAKSTSTKDFTPPSHKTIIFGTVMLFVLAVTFYCYQTLFGNGQAIGKPDPKTYQTPYPSPTFHCLGAGC